MPKDKNKELQQLLSYRTRNAWQGIRRDEMESYTTEYSEFLDRARTERRCVSYAIDYLRSHGFVSLDEAEKKRKNAERKIYHAKAGKAVIAMRIPEGEVSGINLIGAHIDVPRLDLKPVPLVEDSGLAMLKTHYYGGIRKYQWLNIPLALVGTVIDREGKAIEISVGEDPKDPVFVICDLLPHLDDRSGDFKKIFKGKDLNALSGSEPLSFDENFKEAVKLNCLKLLNDKYGITEEDFLSADLELVPALNTREVGLDRSMIGAYGHDDRACSYTALTALVKAERLRRPSCALLLDREEIGSEGITGARSNFWVNMIRRTLRTFGTNLSDGSFENILENSDMLSGDVAAALDPHFKDVHDASNAAKLGHGVVIVKYTGVRGKAMTSEASAEMVGKVRRLLNRAGVKWQSSILGEVDKGGGGTIAKFFAERGVNVIDIGPAVLGMHSPYEIVSKADIYETFRAYKAFYEDNA